MDAVQPDFTVDKNVNTGNRCGVRAAVLIAPDDNLSITPRFMVQRIEADGWNRDRRLQHPGQPPTRRRGPS